MLAVMKLSAGGRGGPRENRGYFTKMQQAHAFEWASLRQSAAMTLISKERAILFADVSGSTALYELLGDKPAAKAIEACLNELRAVVANREGQVVKTIGDEIMVVFGNGEAACDAAREMQQRVIALPPSAGVKLAIRIGFHFGLVLEDKGDFWGDGVNTAARLAALAKAGQILTSGATANALPAPARAHRAQGRAVHPDRRIDQRHLRADRGGPRSAAAPRPHHAARQGQDRLRHLDRGGARAGAVRLFVSAASRNAPAAGAKIRIFPGDKT